MRRALRIKKLPTKNSADVPSLKDIGAIFCGHSISSVVGMHPARIHRQTVFGSG